MFQLIVALLLLPTPGAARVCDWCVFGDKKVTSEVVALATKKPASVLKTLRARGLCVKIMETGRRPPPGAFAWRSVEKPSLSLRKAARLAGLMGTSLCKGELELARSCPTLVLAEDAPFITLLLEYLHHAQSERDPKACAIARKLRSRPPMGDEARLVRDREWDADLLLWNYREKLQLSLDDRVVLTNGIINEAEQRKRFDPDGAQFLVADKPVEYLKGLVEEQRLRQGKDKH